MDDRNGIGCLFPFSSSILFIALVLIMSSPSKTEKPNIEEFEKLTKYPKENILIVEDIPGGPEYFIFKDISGSYDYYSPKYEKWYAINKEPVFTNNDVNKGGYISSNSIFPLDFYLTEEEKKKDYFTLEEMEIIKQRIAEKDASLTRVLS